MNPDVNAWENFGNTVNNAFFYVIDIIINMQDYFIKQAKGIGYIVFFIAFCSAFLNYALTGTGLKENLIKIFKATVFFLIIINVYPRIIGWITSYTFSLAEGSVYDPVNDYFNETETLRETTESWSITYEDKAPSRKTITETVTEVMRDNQHLFSDLAVERKDSPVPHTVVAPANMFKILLFIADDCIRFADQKKHVIPEFSQVLKGLICAFFIIITGAFAILEYIICFLEFMLVASVGVILFPLSIWEGSKFLSEKFIGAIVGFFMKMLFCNIAIFLMLYGFISMFYTIHKGKGFTGNIDQIIFIVFVCLLFFFICKSAPAVAQSLLSGTPSLSASGAISAATGAVAAAGATFGLAKKVGGAAVGGVGGVTKAGFGLVGTMKEANAARHSAIDAVKEAGGSVKQQKAAGRQAFGDSLSDSAGDALKTGAYGLTRSLLSGKNSSSGGSSGGTNPHSWRQDFLSKNQTFNEHFNERRTEGRTRGQASADDYIKSSQQLSANRERQADPDYKSSLDELNKDFPGPSKNDIK